MKINEVILSKEKQTPFCECSYSLKHWENSLQRKAFVCAGFGCVNIKDLEGAYIKHCNEKEDSGDYVIPLCKECISKAGNRPFLIKIGYLAVPVAKTRNCKPYMEPEDLKKYKEWVKTQVNQ